MSTLSTALIGKACQVLGEISDLSWGQRGRQNGKKASKWGTPSGLRNCRLKALLCTSLSRYLNLGCLSDPTLFAVEFWSSRSGWVEGQDPPSPRAGRLESGWARTEIPPEPAAPLPFRSPPRKGMSGSMGEDAPPQMLSSSQYRMTSTPVASLAFPPA